MSNMVYGL